MQRPQPPFGWMGGLIQFPGVAPSPSGNPGLECLERPTIGGFAAGHRPALRWRLRRRWLRANRLGGLRKIIAKNRILGLTMRIVVVPFRRKGGKPLFMALFDILKTVQSLKPKGPRSGVQPRGRDAAVGFGQVR